MRKLPIEAFIDDKVRHRSDSEWYCSILYNSFSMRKEESSEMTLRDTILERPILFPWCLMHVWEKTAKHNVKESQISHETSMTNV